VPSPFDVVHTASLYFQTGDNCDNINGSATSDPNSIWQFNLPPLVIPLYAGTPIIQNCAIATPAAFTIPVVGTSPYFINYTWVSGAADGIGTINNVTDDDNNSATPFNVSIPINTVNPNITYTFNITTFRCGEQTTPIPATVTVTQPSPNILTAVAQTSICVFNNTADWRTMIGSSNKRPILALQDYTGATDFNALGSVTSSVAFDATVQQVNLGGQNYPYLQRNWRVTPTSNGAANVRLYFTQAELNNLAAANTFAGSYMGGLNAATQIQVVRFPSGTIGVGAYQIIPHSVIVLAGANAIAFSSTTNVIAIEFAVPSFSAFIITPSGAALLPLNLVSFDAEKLNLREALLTWTVEKSNETHTYRIERSRDGIQFYTLVEIASHRQTGRDSYTFTDLQPMQGDNYYRVVGIADDGTQEHSSWKVLDFGNTIKGITIAPNPATDYVDIRLEEAAAIDVRVYNQLGQIVVNQQFDAAQNQYRIDLSSLPSAAYNVQILQANGSSKTYTVVKK
jgi:hypothetical protein